MSRPDPTIRKVIDGLRDATVSYEKAIAEIIDRHGLHEHEVRLIVSVLEHYHPAMISHLRGLGLPADEQVKRDFSDCMRATHTKEATA